jgi:prepilin-type processing-associated H-X9-DG protein
VDTNLTNLTSGTLYQYTGSPFSYRCPADQTRVMTAGGEKWPVIRSYAVSSSLNARGGYTNTNPPPPYVHLWKVSAISVPSPSRVWVFAEPDAESHGAPSFAAAWMEPSAWGDVPTDRHSGGCNLSFADGHVEPHRWTAPKEKRLGPIRGLVQPGGDRDDRDWMMAGRPRSQ